MVRGIEMFSQCTPGGVPHLCPLNVFVVLLPEYGEGGYITNPRTMSGAGIVTSLPGLIFDFSKTSTIYRIRSIAKMRPFHCNSCTASTISHQPISRHHLHIDRPHPIAPRLFKDRDDTIKQRLRVFCRQITFWVTQCSPPSEGFSRYSSNRLRA